MENRSSAVPVIILLIILAFGGYMLFNSFQQQTDSALQPLQDANAALQTQVANLLHPTPTIIPDPATYITEIRALARLETIQYSVEKVITAEVGQGAFAFLFGDRLLFVAHGVVIAGIDLSRLDPEHMRLQNGILTVSLPAPEVFVATLDNEKSYVYDRDTGLLTPGDVNLEATARQAAEEEIRKAALEDGILDLARQNAEHFMEQFFEMLGFDTVVFVH